jgi:hypothetical protein
MRATPALIALGLAALPGLSAHDAGMLEAFARAIEPRELVRPSEWVAANVELKPEKTARPGPFNPDMLPFSREIIDCDFDLPHKQGVIGIKPAQVGWSTARIMAMASRAVNDPTNVLYVTTDQVKANQVAYEDFGQQVKDVAAVAATMEAALDEGRRSLMVEIPVVGGKFTFVGAGSENRVIGSAFGHVELDEFEAASEAMPSNRGDLFVSAKNRTWTYRHRSRINAYGHPRLWGQGLHKLFIEMSDQARWVFDCPHCKAAVFPCLDQVRYRQTLASSGVMADGFSPTGGMDPRSAYLECPACSAEITDDQRAAAVWPARMGTGGSGRFESPLAPEDAARRPFAGRWVTRLCDPSATVVGLCLELASCGSEQALMDCVNKTWGEPRRQSRVVVRIEDVAACIQRTNVIRLPAPETGGVAFITVGGDVQAPRDNPTLYVAAVAWLYSGIGHVIALERFSGYNAYLSWLPAAEWPIDGPDQDGRVNVRRVIGVRADLLDVGYATSQTLETQRVPLWSAANMGAPIIRLAGKYVAEAKADNPAYLAPERKRAHPTRPELGLANYWYLHRHTWVDRGMRRIQQKRWVVLCDEPPGFRQHLTANTLQPVESPHGLAPDREEWMKPREFRDDWAQALFYAEAAAAIACGLDRLHLESIGLNTPAGEPMGQTGFVPTPRAWEGLRRGRGGLWSGG